MPRVLLVSQPTDGGVFRHVTDLAAGLPAHGFDVALAAPPLQTPSPIGVAVEVPLVRAASPRALEGLLQQIRARANVATRTTVVLQTFFERRPPLSAPAAQP